jgi:hypothetical protein
MDENKIPEWLLRAAEQTDALVQNLVRATQQYVEEARAAQVVAGLSLLSGSDLTLAMDAGMHELFAAVRRQAEHRTAHGSFAGYASSTASVTGFGSVALPRMGVTGTAEVTAATGTLTVQKETQTDVGMPLDAKTVFLAIMWVFAILLPLKIAELPPEVQTIIRDFLVTIGTALVIHWRVQDGRKR